VRDTLRVAADKNTVRNAVLCLMIRHDLPLSATEWPELHTLIHAVNYMVTNAVWSSHTTTARVIKQLFAKAQLVVETKLASSKSKVHLTTDAWHSPNHKEFQAMNAH
jgi:hypothetical protein